MKRTNLFLSVFMMAVAILGGAGFSMADPLPGVEPIIFEVGWHDPSIANGGLPRTPINPPHASLDDHTLYISSEHSGFTLYLIDESGEESDVVYQAIIPEGVNTVFLPAALSGTYELQLYNGGAYYFYAEIDL